MLQLIPKKIRKNQYGGTLADIPIPTVAAPSGLLQLIYFTQQPAVVLEQPIVQTPTYLAPTLTLPFSGNIPSSIKKVLETAWKGKFYSTSTKRYEDLGTNKYKSKCTSGPATFYKDSLGIKLNGLWWDTGNPKTATKTNITKAGFSEKWSGDGQDVRDGGWKNSVRPGDIMILFSSKSAHAEMWDGTKWISDTNQSSAWCYGKDNGRFGKRSAILYRNDNLWA